MAEQVYRKVRLFCLCDSDELKMLWCLCPAGGDLESCSHSVVCVCVCAVAEDCAEWDVRTSCAGLTTYYRMEHDTA